MVLIIPCSKLEFIGEVSLSKEFKISNDISKSLCAMAHIGSQHGMLESLK